MRTYVKRTFLIFFITAQALSCKNDPRSKEDEVGKEMTKENRQIDSAVTGHKRRDSLRSIYISKLLYIDSLKAIGHDALYYEAKANKITDSTKNLDAFLRDSASLNH